MHSTLYSQATQMSLTFIRRHNSALTRIVMIGTCLVPVFAVVLGLCKLRGGWDDGAITAAFSRTFADTGLIALTPLSPQVEGFSSLSWFLLLTICHPFASSASTYLVWMKALSALFFLFSIVIFYPISRKFLNDRTLAVFSTWLMALSITPFYETFNGMEMNLALFLFLALVYILMSDLDGRLQVILAWIVATLFLATRFEAPYMLLALLVGLILGRKERPRCLSWASMSILFIAICGSYIGMEVWRHHAFGMWMPNTIYAKLWWPYQPEHTWHAFFANRAEATLEIIVVLFAPLLVAFGVFAKNRHLTKNRPGRDIDPIIGSLACAAFLFGIFFGKNMGHRGRMTESLIPFAALFLAILLKNVSRSRSEMRFALLVTAVLHLGIWLGIAHRLATSGDGVPVSKYEREGLASDDIRQLLHRKSLTIMIPDVGGAALCCRDLRILDLGLLANPILAREGYGNFQRYFKLNQPDVVVAHEVWAVGPHIYAGHLLDDYSLVQVKQTRLFLRNDLYSQLLLQGVGRVHAVADLPFCMGGFFEDQEYSKKKKYCLALEE
jgi:phage terminase large subunit-like protein